MAIYNLNSGNLEFLIDHSFSRGTENVVIDAIKSPSIVTPWTGKTGVEVETTSGFTIPQNAQIFLDTGSHNTIMMIDGGAQADCRGRRGEPYHRYGPRGDTLVGGAGAESA